MFHLLYVVSSRLSLVAFSLHRCLHRVAGWCASRDRHLLEAAAVQRRLFELNPAASVFLPF